jgi:hypothetical protein
MVVVDILDIMMTPIDLSKPFIYGVFFMSETVAVTCHS